MIIKRTRHLRPFTCFKNSVSHLCNVYVQEKREGMAAGFAHPLSPALCKCGVIDICHIVD